MLYEHGFSSSAVSRSTDDGLRLFDCRVTNAVKCLPPNNRPVASEINNCSDYLERELRHPRVVLALGGVAHKAVVRALGLRQADFRFGHGAVHALADGRVIVDSYHCSRYNLNTRRLSESMFADVFSRARHFLASDGLPVGASAP